MAMDGIRQSERGKQDGVQYLAHFGFVVAAAYFDFKCGRVYPVFRVFPRLFAVARVVVVGVVVAPVAKPHAVGVDAHTLPSDTSE